jgi:hypothetical protein
MWPNKFLSNLVHEVNRGKKNNERVGYFCYLQNLPKVKKHPMGENSPNLVNLPRTEAHFLTVESAPNFVVRRFPSKGRSRRDDPFKNSAKLGKKCCLFMYNQKLTIPLVFERKSQICHKIAENCRQ